MSCCADGSIVIIRGNDTDFNGQAFVTINFDTDVLDLSTFKATFKMGGITKTFDDLSSGSISLSYSAAETGTMPFGENFGVLRLFDTSGRVATIESLIPFCVKNIIHGDAIATKPSTMNIKVEQGGENILNIKIDAGVTVEVIPEVDTLPAGSNAYVQNEGTENHLVLKFGISQGEKGEQGEEGPRGPEGPAGPAGKDGKDGVDGKDAKINGVNTLTLNTTYGISLSQSGSTATISGKEITDVVDGISALIPAQATEQNQLADKQFVNSSIATNTANFIGTFELVSELEAYSGVVTNNDYAFVVNQVVTDNGNDWATFNDLDAYDKSLLTNMDYAWVINGSNFDLYRFDIVEQDWELRVQNTPKAGISLNTAYNRYKAIVSGNTVNWEYEYTLNNSSFTANQWAAINSGATTTNIGQITTNQNAIGTLSSLTTTEKTNLVGAINEVKTTADSKVSDITIDETSIVTDGVAVIPNASGSVTGVTRLSADLTSISNTIAATASMGNTLAKNIITGVDIYSSSSTYSVGDKVRYGQYYYECITAITTAHAWNASEWQEITIQGQIDEKVDDVTVNGTSIVNGTTKVAEIPIAQQSGSYGLVKLSDANTGLTISSSGNLVVSAASNLNIDGKVNVYRPIVPSNLDYAVKRGLAYNNLTLTDAEKASACSLVGALPNNIYGESTTAAATVQKEVSIPSITSLNAGQLIIVKPTVTSTAANSTLKLNNFDAYPMLYGGNAITTATDSYVWIKDVPGWWLFDGSNWLFAGHGYDINTTYNSTTLALMIEGTNTTNRLIAPSILKDGTFGVVTAYASGDTITPADKYLYTSTADISALTVNAPDSPDERYVSQINFSSGTTATTLSVPSSFYWIEGSDDIQVVNGIRVFVPISNHRYTLIIFCDGVGVCVIAKRTS